MESILNTHKFSLKTLNALCYTHNMMLWSSSLSSILLNNFDYGDLDQSSPRLPMIATISLNPVTNPMFDHGKQTNAITSYDNGGNDVG